MVENLMGSVICPNCQCCVKYAHTPGGLMYCPKCNYSPSTARVLFGSTNQDVLSPDTSAAPRVQ